MLRVTCIKIDGKTVDAVPKALCAELLRKARRELTKTEVEALERYLRRDV